MCTINTLSPKSFQESSEIKKLRFREHKRKWNKSKIKTECIRKVRNEGENKSSKGKWRGRKPRTAISFSSRGIQRFWIPYRRLSPAPVFPPHSLSLSLFIPHSSRSSTRESPFPECHLVLALAYRWLRRLIWYAVLIYSWNSYRTYPPSA